MSDTAGRRTTPRRPIELVAACMDRRGKEGLCVAVTISTPKQGMHREVFECGPTPAGLISAIRRIADWLERDYMSKSVKNDGGAQADLTAVSGRGSPERAGESA